MDWWTGEPAEGLFISPEGFLEDLAAVRDKGRITIRICSNGGDLYTGIAIYNQLRDLRGEKTAIIDGMAASAASVIAMAGDRRLVHAGDTIMIHEAAVMLCDSYNLQQLSPIEKMLKAANKAAAEIYAARTGMDAESVRAMMGKTSWLVGQEAVDMGFATELADGPGPQMTLSADKSRLLVNGMSFSVAGLGNLPGSIPVMKAEPPVPRTTTDEGGRKRMTLEELKKESPELLVQLEAEARTAAAAEAAAAERARLQAIEEIAPGVGDPALVHDAKYGDRPLTAQELAFAAMQRQAKLGGDFLAAMKKDGEQSRAGDVAAAPNGGTGGEPDDEQQKVAEMVAAYNRFNGKGAQK